MLSDEVMKKCSDIEKEIVFTGLEKFENKYQIAGDFMQKIKSKEVESLDDYIGQIRKRNSTLISYTAEHLGYLQTVEK